MRPALRDKGLTLAIQWVGEEKTNGLTNDGLREGKRGAGNDANAGLGDDMPFGIGIVDRGRSVDVENLLGATTTDIIANYGSRCAGNAEFAYAGEPLCGVPHVALGQAGTGRISSR